MGPASESTCLLGKLPGAGWEPPDPGAPSKSFLVLLSTPQVVLSLGCSATELHSTLPKRTPVSLCMFFDCHGASVWGPGQNPLLNLLTWL